MITILREIRIKRNESITNVAKKIGINAVVLSRIESGIRMPTLRHLILLSNYYNTKIDYLIEGLQHKVNDAPTPMSFR